MDDNENEDETNGHQEILDDEVEIENSQIFRKETTERISDPEHLDALLVVINPSLWLLLGGLLLVMFSILLWTLMGSLPIKISGKGIFESKQGTFAIHAPHEGSVHEIAVEPGQAVKKGDFLVSIGDIAENAPGESFKVINTPYDGRVVDILIHPGEVVLQGNTLIWLEHAPSPENPLVVEGYFPIELGGSLSVGQKVEMSNGMDGIISKVSTYGASVESMGRNFQTKGLEKYLSGGSYAVISAIINPDFTTPSLDDGNKSKFNRHSEVTTGTIVNLNVTVGRVKPIYYLFPSDKFKEH